MEVIPVINCKNFDCVREKFEKVAQLGSEWIKIDVSDGKFTPAKTWNSPRDSDFNHLTSKFKLNIEVHLMVEKPEEFIDGWLEADAKRLIIHLESLKNGTRERLEKILEKCAKHEAEVMLAINPSTPVEELFSYLDLVYYFQFLAVTPGPSGQEFDELTIEKLKVLRERAPDAVIEVDGGVNPSVAEQVKNAGADVVASSSYIWGSKNPEEAFLELQKI